MEYVIDHNTDVVALTETWLKADDQHQDNAKYIGDVTPDGYDFKHVAIFGKKVVELICYSGNHYR